MDPKIYSKTWCDQSACIGTGLHDPHSASTLTFAKAGGEGLCWEFHWQDEKRMAWCDLNQWRNAVESKIPHDSLDEIEPELLEIAARWSWGGVSARLEQAKLFESGLPLPGAIAYDWYPVLTLQAGGKPLEFALPDWPAELLRSMTEGWLRNPDGGISKALKIALPVFAGWLVIPYTQLQQAAVGSVLFPSGMKADRCYVQMENTLVELLMNDENDFSVVAIHNDTDGEIFEKQMAAASVQNVPVTVRVEIARVSMNFQQLSEINVGDCLTLDLEPRKEIRLILNGCVIGHGDLVKLDDRMGVRITHLF
ncbi:type III secretion system cytoplasmic ring protein SctQ [Enterobacter asburiae]|uniref:type III secretion system cytoplasmic ring protein SctQ n=1 Tax=Enterobacter asburiae TaxID=61645 RepID=UPI0020037184|nr:type III secretion system cytoplasmic ring protein SctQ [Enterobacter asburiae]MCK7227219.1 type III secretion system cytoplasmic ring protein SctQ [Enterobacter asburiae]